MKTVTQILFTILIALLMLAGCASKPSPNLCPTVCDGLVAYYPFYGDATDKSGFIVSFGRRVQTEPWRDSWRK